MDRLMQNQQYAMELLLLHQGNRNLTEGVSMENQRTRMTKRLLCEHLIQMMQEKPIDEISVSELCRRAGINRTTFYRYYTIPRDILSDIQSDLKIEYDCILSGADNRVERLAGALRFVRNHSGRAAVLNDGVNRAIDDASDNLRKDDPFFQMLAGTVPEPLRPYARHMTSAAMTLWLKEGCRLDEINFAKMLTEVCMVCTALCPDNRGEE